jgi:apolipoprotein N-acyltransferase
MFTADLFERAVKTWLQTFLTVFLGALVVPANVFSVTNWKAAALGALAGAVAAAFSAVMSLLSKPVGDKTTASLIKPGVTPGTSSSGLTDLP